MSWRIEELGTFCRDIAMGPFGSNLKAANFTEHGVPVLRGQNLSGFYVDLTGAVFVTEAKAKSLGRAVTSPGDIVITHRGTLGQVSMVPFDSQPMVVSQSQMRLTLDPKRLSPIFLNYWLRSPMGQHLLLTNATQTGVPALAQPTASLKRLKVPIPPLGVQHLIASILGSLDDKIASNVQAIERTDELRQLLWKSALLRGSVTRGLNEIAEFVNGGAFTKGASGTGRVVVRIAELNSGLGGSTVRSNLEVPESRTAYPGDLLFAWSGSLTICRWKHAEAIVNQHIFKVLPKSIFPIWAVECAIRAQMPIFKSIAAGKATTMGHINRADLEIGMPMPSSFTASELAAGMTLWSLAVALERENEVLARTRDELLPLLMSGRITVAAAAEVVDEMDVKKRKDPGNV